MASNPSTRWFFNDWRSDIGLRCCSLAARGLWIEMLGICAAAERRGYLEVAGKPCSIRKIAELAGAPKSTVHTLLRELEENGVFSRDAEGTIFNRRMVREAAKCPAKAAQNSGQWITPNQPDLFNNSPAPHARACEASRLQDSPSSLNQPPESQVAAREGGKNEVMNPQARLTPRLGVADAPPRPSRPSRGSSAVERRAEDPGGGGSIPSLGAFTPIGAACPQPPEPRAAPRRSPLRRRKPEAIRRYIKDRLLPVKQARFLTAYRPDLLAGYLEATTLQDGKPVDPDAFQFAVDGVAKVIELNHWQDPHGEIIERWKDRHCDSDGTIPEWLVDGTRAGPAELPPLPPFNPLGIAA